MGVFLNLLLCSMLIGVLGGIPLGTGVFIYVHDIVLVVGVLYGSISLRSQKHIPIPRLLKPILLFTFVGIMSLLLNATSFPLPDLMRSSLYLIRWVLYACLYVLLIALKIPARIMLLRLFQFGCAFAILGILQFLLYPNLRFLLYLGWDPHYYRLFSTLLDPNFAGILLVFTILLGYYLFKKEGNITLVVWIVFLICCVYLTYSRSSYLALITGAFVLGVLQKQWKILFAILFFIACILFIPRPGGNTLSLLREDSTFSRISNWQQSANLFLESPVFGHGFNTLRLMQTTAPNDSVTFISHAAAGVDSSILFLLVTTGIVGLTAYLNLLYMANISDKKQKKTAQIQNLYISSICALLVHSLFVNSLFYPWVLLWMWILIATMEIIYDM